MSASDGILVTGGAGFVGATLVSREVGIPRTWEWFQREVFRDYQPSS